MPHTFYHDEENKLYSLEETMEILGVSRQWVLKLLKDGRLSGVRILKRWKGVYSHSISELIYIQTKETTK